MEVIMQVKWKVVINWILLVITCCACQFPVKKNPNLPDFEPVQLEVSHIDFINKVPETAQMNAMEYEYYYNGGGTAAADFNRDGLTDLIFTSNLGPEQLYLNQGDFKFKNITATSGIKHSKSWTTGITIVDINQDGWPDFYCSKSGRLPVKHRKNELYINNGDLTFTERAAQYNLDHAGYSTQAIFFDYDLDNDLDVFILNHNINKLSVTNTDSLRASYAPYVGDQLMENTGGHFKNVTVEAGIHAHAMGFGLGAEVGDFNQDGFPDIYVSNDYNEHDYLYINQQNGSFKEQMKSSMRHGSNFSMGVSVSDLNNDLRPDVVVLDMVSEKNYGIKTSMSGMNPAKFRQAVDQGFHYQYMFNSVQLNQGNMKFSEVAQWMGVSNTDWSWAPLTQDFNLDGTKDLYITNGIQRDFRNNDYRVFKKKRVEEAYARKENYTDLMLELIHKTPERPVEDHLYFNSGGLKMERVQLGLMKNFANGATFADLDNDGDLEIITNNVNSYATILKNNAVEKQKRHYLKVKLEGPKGNVNAIGATVVVHQQSMKQQYYQNYTKGYQSASAELLTIGLDINSDLDSVEVIWPDNTHTVLQEVGLDAVLQVGYAAHNKLGPKPKQLEDRMVDPKVLGIGYVHAENEFDDYKRESLLPHKQSNLGPALAVGDINNDGLEDVFFGGSMGQAGRIYLQKQGSFMEPANKVFELDKIYEDNDAIFMDIDGDKDLDLIVGTGGYELTENHVMLQDRVYENIGAGLFKKKQVMGTTNTSKMVALDFNNDEQMDLLVAGKAVPGQYPRGTGARLLENKKGRFVDVTAQHAPALLGLGMVTDVAVGKVDGNEMLDLFFVGEWMEPIWMEVVDGTIIQKQINSQQKLKGWYFSVDIKDMDGSGNKEVLLGNLGLNYKYKASDTAPFYLYSGDVDANGRQDLLLGYVEQGAVVPLRGRECTSNQIPSIKEKYPTYHAFASATIADVIGESLGVMEKREVHNFASGYLKINDSGLAEFTAFENAFQMSSINDFIAYDFNSNGKEELFAAGNLFGSEPETPRADGSYGMMLENTDGGWRWVENQDHQIYTSGEVKKMEIIAMDGVDYLICAANDGPPQFFKLETKLE